MIAVPFRWLRSTPFYLIGSKARIHRGAIRFLPAIEGKRPVNSWGGVNQRFREFRPEILGFGRNLEGSFRTLVCLSGNGDPRAGVLLTQTVAAKAVKAKRPAAGLSASGVNWKVA